MKNTKTSSLLRLVAFLLITVVLIGVVGVISEGIEKEPNGDIQNNTDNNIPSPPATDIPAVNIQYENYLSGLLCSKEESDTIPLCYMMHTSGALYGIKDAELTIEFPVENGQSRLLVYTSKTSHLGKIGSVASARMYLASILSTFGGILVHNSVDDTILYTDTRIENSIDISKSNVYSYTEGHGLIYTNASLITNALEDLKFTTQQITKPSLPFVFDNNYESIVRGQYPCRNIHIPMHANNNLSLIYDITTREYMIEQNGTLRMDSHTGEYVSYKNAFILFSNTTTYERAETTELVFEVEEGGTGYYFTEGAMEKIIWETDGDGHLVFKNLSGEKLTVNRGTTYISFYKTTQKKTITIY